MSAVVREGIGVSPGVAVGTALVVERGVGEVPERKLAQDEAAEELARVEAAIDAVRRELPRCRAARRARSGGGHCPDLRRPEDDPRGSQLPCSPSASGSAKIFTTPKWAVQTVGVELQARFARIDDPYLRARGADIETLTTHLLRILLGQKAPRLDRLDRPVIVVAHDISPAQTATLDREYVLGFVTDAGGANQPHRHHGAFDGDSGNRRHARRDPACAQRAIA